ncbi:hypothetical protein ACK3SF_02375 [Candidatus Nanosalina sp. VS9-1]|uniref:hypothetical protein n=1 Tax=Candidatus Nanosalina sp. VS9-1 TaxID=3388566 RepID=UPI0039E13293
MIYCGIDLTEDDSTESTVAFLSDSVESYSFETNEELAEKIIESQPNIVAVNTGLKERRGLSEEEEELQEEGHIFTPASHDTQRVRRFQDLKRRIQAGLAAEDRPEFIRFDPAISGRELALDSDRSLESLGVEASGIESSREFDAVLGAVTARFYDQGQAEEMDVVVPTTLKDDSDDESSKSL